MSQENERFLRQSSPDFSRSALGSETVAPETDQNTRSTKPVKYYVLSLSVLIINIAYSVDPASS